MKKSTLLKLMGTCVAVMFSFGVMAQGNPGDYKLISADPVTANASYVTIGKAIPLYVQPDPVYHPTWTAFSNGITTGFTWVFTAADAPASITLNQPSSLNYVEITGVTEGGPYPVNVHELAPVAFGGCHDVGKNFNIYVTGKPTAGIAGTNTPANSWSVTTPSYEYYACGSKVAETLNLTITESGAPDALKFYAYSVQKRVVILDVDGNEEDVVSTTNIIDHTVAAKGLTSSVATGDLDVLDYDWGTGTAVPSRTLYEFTLAPATDAVAGITGIISAISHKSDYLALSADPTAYTDYPFTGKLVVTYLVNPTPSTGPIYHIPNDFAF